MRLRTTPLKGLCAAADGKSAGRKGTINTRFRRGNAATRSWFSVARGDESKAVNREHTFPATGR
jgi:hypothetical protein